MRSFIFTRRNLLLGFSALGGLSAIPISSANQVPKLPRPSSEPVMGDWKGFKYDEKEFGHLRELVLKRLPLIQSAFVGGERIAEAVEADRPVAETVYDAWTGDWQGDLLGFDPSGAMDYGVRFRQVLEPCTKETVSGRTTIVQPINMIYQNGSNPPVREQAFNVIRNERLYCVFYNQSEGKVPFLGYEITPGHCLWVREGTIFSERLHTLPDNRRLFHIKGVQMPAGPACSQSQLNWMEGWYHGVS